VVQVRVGGAVVAVVLAALVASAPAAALTCPQGTIRARIDGASAVFAGTLLSSRPQGDERIYRFEVVQPIKGPLGSEIEIRAPELVDASDKPLRPGTDAGVFATLDGATFTTDSCGLTDPGVLLAEADEPRGMWIKVLVGIGILAAALAYSLMRLRRRGTPSVPG
jgi:hypothetical protein